LLGWLQVDGACVEAPALSLLDTNLFAPVRVKPCMPSNGLLLWTSDDPNDWLVSLGNGKCLDTWNRDYMYTYRCDPGIIYHIHSLMSKSTAMMCSNHRLGSLRLVEAGSWRLQVLGLMFMAWYPHVGAAKWAPMALSFAFAFACANGQGSALHFT